MIIKKERSIIIAADVSFDSLTDLVKNTAAIDAIGGYKLGFELALEVGLPRAVEAIRKISDKAIIYDHQKAGTDIPDTGKAFARVCKKAGLDGVILFPQAGPNTEEAWIKAAKESGLDVIVGGLMTHKGYMRSDGGYLADDAIIEIYVNAIKEGVVNFVAPATKPEATRKIRVMLEHEGIDPVIYTPGLGAQGGDMKAVSEAAGKRWHAIVGRAIYEASDVKAAATQIAKTWEEACRTK